MKEQSIPVGPAPVLVDPDPFTVVATVLTATSVILQFVQVMQGRDRPTAAALASATPTLASLQASIEELRQQLKRIERAILRGSKEPEKEFYERKFRISIGVLELESAHHEEFSRSLPSLLNAVGSLSRWANSLIARNPQVAALLGEQLLEGAGDAADRLNTMIASGASNREILAECRKIIDTLEGALDQASDKREN